MHVHDSLNFTLCSRSRCGARKAMTVGCKPTKANMRTTTTNWIKQMQSPAAIAIFCQTFALPGLPHGPLGVLPKGRPNILILVAQRRETINPCPV